ncbi:MAG TPA: pyruvate kinase [Ilumatobacteraceae bacterium]|nr:pyruvate kinase [Ilumatobacteraceae bacterium]
MNARTKIVATLGPSTDRPGVLDELLRAGLDVVRLNLSHGHLEEHIGRLHAVRAAAARTGANVAALADLPGPKVRAAPFPGSGVELEPGSTVTMVTGAESSSRTRIGVDYDTLLQDLRADDRIVVGDGAITLAVERVDADGVECRVRSGGHVQGRPGIHLPSERLRIMAPTDDDLVLAQAMASAGTDFIAVSFVRGPHDIESVRKAIAPADTRLVAKIETLPAIQHLDEIIEASDALMVARGDLGIECPLEDVPHMQKRIVRTCVRAGVPVITATQMMESMVTAPSPTRAEVSDVANAVFDGSDALMLSGETAIGIDPVNVVKTMARVAERAELEANYAQWAEKVGRFHRQRGVDGPDRITTAITHAAGLAANDSGATAILCCTRSGRTALAMARFRPSARLIGLSPDPVTVRALALAWGITGLQVETYTTTDELVWFAVESAVQNGLVHSGETVLVLAGAPDRPSGASTDVLRIVRVA